MLQTNCNIVYKGNNEVIERNVHFTTAAVYCRFDAEDRRPDGRCIQTHVDGNTIKVLMHIEAPDSEGGPYHTTLEYEVVFV